VALTDNIFERCSLQSMIFVRVAVGAVHE
jgi:hypothetical protein